MGFTEAGSYVRLIDSCITQLKAQGPSRTCNESKEEGVTVSISSKPSARNTRHVFAILCDQKHTGLEPGRQVVRKVSESPEDAFDVDQL